MRLPLDDLRQTRELLSRTLVVTSFEKVISKTDFSRGPWHFLESSFFFGDLSILLHRWAPSPTFVWRTDEPAISETSWYVTLVYNLPINRSEAPCNRDQVSNIRTINIVYIVVHKHNSFQNICFLFIFETCIFICIFLTSKIKFKKYLY